MGIIIEREETVMAIISSNVVVFCVLISVVRMFFWILWLSTIRERWFTDCSLDSSKSGMGLLKQSFSVNKAVSFELLGLWLWQLLNKKEITVNEGLEVFITLIV